MSSRKETNFFTEKRFGKGLDWYESFFTGKAKAYGEASGIYTKRHLFPGVPERIHATIPEVKLIYIVRDPIERIISHYVHNYAHGRASKPWPEAISQPENNYVLTSKYYYQVEAFRQYFPDERILIVASEDLKSKTREVLRSVFEFIGVDPYFESDDFNKQYHVSAQKQRRSILDRHIHNRKIKQFLQPVLPSFMTKAAAFDRPSLSEADRERLVGWLAPDVEKLRAFTGTRFESWSL